MRCVPFLASVALSGLACAATATAAPAAPAWTDRAPDPPVVNRARISVPRDAGTLKVTEVRDYGSEGLDDVAQYASADSAVSGTIFVYYPTLPDTGLTFLATDATIRRRFGPATRIAQDRLVTVGGVANAGRRVVYEGASEGRSTAAMFIRAGGWILVLRVTGPQSRAEEIAADVDALAAGLHFPAATRPVPAHVIAVEPCPMAVREQDAPLSRPPGPQATMLVLMTATNDLHDAKGKPLANQFGRVPDRLCLASSAADRDPVVLTYRPVTAAMGIYVPRLFRLVGDAGYILEATAAKNRPDQVVVVQHGIGRLSVYGLFRDAPSTAQLERLSARNSSVPMIGSTELRPEGGSDIHLDCRQFLEGCGKPDKPVAAAARPGQASAAISSR